MHLRRRPGPIGARGDANEKRADFSGRVARRRGGVAAGTTPPAGATVVPHAAKRSGRPFWPSRARRRLLWRRGRPDRSCRPW